MTGGSRRGRFEEDRGSTTGGRGIRRVVEEESRIRRKGERPKNARSTTHTPSAEIFNLALLLSRKIRHPLCPSVTLVHPHQKC